MAALGFIALAVVAFEFSAPAAPETPRTWKQGYVYYVESAGYLYSFDSAWRVETLRTAPAAGRPAGDRLTGEPERVAHLRKAFLENLGAAGLDQVPVEGARELASIRSMGYL